MKYQKLISYAFLALGFMQSGTAIANYTPGPRVDARELNIGGVQIGMTYDDALAALVESYDVDPTEIEVVNLKKFVGDEIKEYPGSISFSSDKSSGIRIGLPSSGWVISVRFGPTVTFQEDLSVQVAAIEYKMAWTQENQQNLKQAALEKYGEATVNRGAMGYQWCDNPNARWANCESEAIMAYSGRRQKYNPCLIKIVNTLFIQSVHFFGVNGPNFSQRIRNKNCPHIPSVNGKM